MNSWVITYNGVDTAGDILYESYQTIYGRTASDALEKHYGKKFERASGDSARYADIILVKGVFDNGMIHTPARSQRLCFRLSR